MSIFKSKFSLTTRLYLSQITRDFRKSLHLRTGVKSLTRFAGNPAHVNCKCRLSQKKFARFVGFGIKCIWPIFKTEMLIYQSKINLDEKILFGKITHLLDPEIRQNAGKGHVLEPYSTFHSGQ